MNQNNAAESELNWESAEKVLKDWFRRARESQHTHYEAARHFDRINLLMSIPVVALLAALGTGAFASIEKNVSNEWKILFGIIGLFTAGLAAVQSNLKLVERSEKHRRIGSGYGAIRREIEESLVIPIENRPQIVDFLPKIRARLDHLASDSPDIPRKVWIAALKLAERDSHLSGSDPKKYIELESDKNGNS